MTHKFFFYLAPTPQGLGEQGDWARAKVDTERRAVRLASSLQQNEVITFFLRLFQNQKMFCIRSDFHFRPNTSLNSVKFLVFVPTLVSKSRKFADVCCAGLETGDWWATGVSCDQLWWLWGDTGTRGHQAHYCLVTISHHQDWLGAQVVLRIRRTKRRERTEWTVVFRILY